MQSPYDRRYEPQATLRRSRRAVQRLLPAALPALLALVLLAGPGPAQAAAGDGIARAVFFYTPACPHCHELLNGRLPAIVAQHGDRLRLLTVDASTPVGRRLFRAAVEDYSVPDRKRGVPAVVIGDQFLAGVRDISEQLPQLVTISLDNGGVDWPAIAGLPDAIAASRGAVVTSADQLISSAGDSRDVLDRLAADRWGNALALIVLVGMLGAVGMVIARLVRAVRAHGRTPLERGAEAVAPPPVATPSRRLSRVTIALLVLGIGITTYLTYVRASSSFTLCGPVGNCDEVQQSVYSRLFGVLPVAYLGLAAYVSLVIAFAVARLARPSVARPATWAFLSLALAGTLFSIYLTALEPFVIGATCMWCVTSAVIMTGLLLVSAWLVGLMPGSSLTPTERVRPARPRAERRRAARARGR